MSTLIKEHNRISIKIKPTLNSLLEKIEKQSGISKSAIVEAAIENYLKKRLYKDSKKLSTLRFDDLPTEEEWLSIQSKI